LKNKDGNSQSEGENKEVRNNNNVGGNISNNVENIKNDHQLNWTNWKDFKLMKKLNSFGDFDGLMN
jgi:hypothetical protein